MEDYQSKIVKLERDIETIEIQGATNVALAVLEGMEYATHLPGDVLENVESVGFKLSTARENEPLARNGLKFVLGKLKDSASKGHGLQVLDAIEEFTNLIAKTKVEIVQHGKELLSKYDVVLTHCHSSTAVKVLIEAHKINPNLQVVSTETRPLYQGRKTASKLLEAGVKVTQVVDSASASFIVDDRYLPVGAVIVGADEVYLNGNTINKVGSYQIALSASHGNDELYVATTLLKVDPYKRSEDPNIEIRSSKEVWPDAPSGLGIINPAFEMIPGELITGFITEAGIIKADQIKSYLEELYPWM